MPRSGSPVGVRAVWSFLLNRAFALATLVGLCFWFSFASGVAFVGEGWFVQVIHRVANGETLYRDVAYGAGPLPVLVAAALARITGANVLLLKALVALTWAVTIWTGRGILRAAGRSVWTQGAYVATCLLLAPTPLSPLYQVMASLFMAASYRLAIAAIRDGRQEALLLAAGAAGLSAASKQNVGLYALAALLVSCIIVARRNRAVELRARSAAALRVLVAFALGVGPFFALALFTAGVEDLWQSVAANKGAYVSFGGISLTEGLADALEKVWPPHAARPFDLLHALGFLIAPVAVIVPFCTGMLLRGGCGPVLVPVACFSVASFAAVFPRADRIHVTYMLPLLLVGFWWGLSLLSALRPRRLAHGSRAVLKRMSIATLFVFLVGTVLWPGLEWVRGDRTVCQLPGFRGPLVSTRQERRLQRLRADLVPRVSGRRVFFLSPRAGFWYRTLELPNPTPVDFPYRSLLTAERRQRIITALKSGGIHVVCVEEVDSPLWPARLHAQIGRDFDFEGSVGPLRLYAAASRIVARADDRGPPGTRCSRGEEAGGLTGRRGTAVTEPTEGRTR